MYPWLKEEKPFVPGPIKNSKFFEGLSKSGARPVRRKFEDILNEPEVKHEVSRAPLPKNDYYKGLAVPLRKSDKYVKPEKTDYRTTRERGEFAVSARLNALVTPRVVTEKFAEKKEREETEAAKRQQAIAMLDTEPSEYWNSMATPLRPLPKVSYAPGGPGGAAGDGAAGAATPLKSGAAPDSARGGGASGGVAGPAAGGKKGTPVKPSPKSARTKGAANGQASEAADAPAPLPEGKEGEAEGGSGASDAAPAAAAAGAEGPASAPGGAEDAAQPKAAGEGEAPAAGEGAQWEAANAP